MIRRRSWPTREAVELATLLWVNWFNYRRLCIHSGDTSRVIGALASMVALGITFMIALFVVNYRNSLHKLEAIGSAQATLNA